MPDISPAPLALSAVNKDVQALAQRLAREKRARMAAEATIERKSRELFAANKELEQLFSGSMKVLADVLAMARPELFQKAGKVERWAKRIAPHVGIERCWVLDLAAMLYPIGMLSLPDDIIQKKALDADLNADERKALAESTQAAHDLLITIPRMEPVARAVLYCNKGFDGSGYPYDGVKGREIPEAARILKVLIDLSDEATGVDRTRDFKKMAEHRELYDVEILKVAYAHLRRARGQQDAAGVQKSLAPSHLLPGDVVDRDIVDAQGRLLLAAGSVLSEITIRRLCSLRMAKLVAEEIDIVRKA
ncbi:HD-GYP domain-containing protein [Rhodobium gokarnense]|uniref:Response regulator RpfG family c-di-GMP phosphodiesterase n=1 Tax=Rhodobium gokarnense TaxID=364296 RepID=A0ABT3HA21_9HYPH|nr:HD domain-containing phosphohydrolase [Rhodobium gokarnense]MCW2307238.1 response regulator RpfG family c-di-GMP phosphodiesterase [Rhodobium gokarnense]